MKKIFIYSILVLFTTIGCKVKYATENTIEKDTKFVKFIKLTKDYKVYVRQDQKKYPYYYPKNNDGKLAHTEFQYFLIKNDSVIYITTLPSKNYFDKSNRNVINGRSINLFFFNFFYFGKKNVDNNITFENDEKKQIWKFDAESDKIVLNSLNNYVKKKVSKDSINSYFEETLPTKEIFGKKIEFKELKEYKGITHIDCFENDCDNDSPKDDSLTVEYIKLSYNKKGEIKNIEFIFNKNVLKHYNSYKFKKNRVKYY